MADETYSIKIEVDSRQVKSAERDAKKFRKTMARVERSRIKAENLDRSKKIRGEMQKLNRVKALTIRRDRELASAASRRGKAQAKANRQISKQRAFDFKVGQINAANKPLSRMDKLTKSLGPGLFNAAAGAAALGAALVIGVGTAVTKFAQGVIGAKEFNTANKVAFSSLLGGAAAGEEAMAKSEALADTFGFRLQDVTGSMKKLLAAQFTLGQSETFLKMGADLRAIGTDAEGVKGAIRAITQIKAKGRLQADELLQLSEANISQQLIFSELQSNLGLDDIDAVRKMIEAGKVKSDEALKAILGAVGKKTGSKEAGEAGKKFADVSLDAARNRIANSGFNVFRDVAGGEPEAFKQLTKIGKGISEFFDNLDRGDLGDIFKTAISAFDAFAEVSKAFLGGFLGGLAENSDETRSFFDMLKDPKMLEGIASIGSALGIITTAIVKIGAAMVELQGTRLFAIMSLFGDQDEAMRSGGTSLAGSLVSGFVSGISNGRGPIEAVVNSLAQLAIGTFGGPKGIDSGSPSKVFESFGGDVIDGFSNGLETPSQAAASNGGTTAPEGLSMGTTNNFSMGGMSVNTEVNEAQGGADMAAQIEKSSMAIIGRAFEAMALQGGTA